MDSTHTTDEIGYDNETAEKYSAGQDTFFNVDKVKDGATIAMAEQIRSLATHAPLHTVVDIGCGSNTDYLRLWKECAQARAIVGVEPSARMRELLLQRLTPELKENFRLSDGNWLHTNLEDSTADLVVSRFSFHNIKNTADGYKELSRVLKPGGYAVISLPYPDFCKKELESEGREAVEGATMDVKVFDVTVHYYYHELDTYLGENLTRNGLVCIEHQALNWGTKNPEELKTPNTLVYTLKKA